MVLNPWASVSKTVETARRFVAALGRDLTDPNEIVEYLRTVPAQRLIEVQETMLTPEVMIAIRFMRRHSIRTFRNLQDMIPWLMKRSPSVESFILAQFLGKNQSQVSVWARCRRQKHRAIHAKAYSRTRCRRFRPTGYNRI